MEKNLDDQIDNSREDEYLDSLEIGSDSNDDEKKADDNVEATEPIEIEDANEAVDQVVKEESDRLLRSEDEALERQFSPPKEDKSIKSKLKNVVLWWWEHRLVRYGSLLGLFLLLTASVILPPPRYFVLNAVGIRVQSSMKIVDSKTGLALKNIPVQLQGQEKRSDDEGHVAFDGLKLGNTDLVIEKLGYATYEKELVLGWGSNPIGDQPLTATGTQFTFVVQDWLSGKPITSAEATSGEDTAKADDEGKIVLTVGELNDDTKAKVSAQGYRQEELSLAEVSNEQTVKLVPDKKHVFVSNRSGHYDLYKIDVDSMNEEILIPASGEEREIPHVVPHPTKSYAAYISTRDGEANSGGFIFDGLFIVDVKTGDYSRIIRSEQLQIVGWVGDKLIYTAVTEGVSAANPERSRIYSYDIETSEKKQLATSNYFNDVKIFNDKIYYAVSSFAVPESSAKLFSVKPDGSDKQTAADMQVWDIIRASYDLVNFRAVDGAFQTVWLSLKSSDAQPKKLDAPPVVQNSRSYSVSKDKTYAAWVDQRDGKGVLLKYVVADGSEEILHTAAGVNQPVYWLNDHDLVYRVATNDETADYILNVDGGEPHKISDVIGNQSRYFY